MRFDHENYEEFKTKINELIFNLSEVLLGKVKSDWDKAQCNEAVRKHVTPRVEFIWHMFPLDFLLGGWAWVLDCLSFPLWLCMTPILICAIPWNLCCWIFIALPVVLIFVMTLPCVTCWAGFL